MIICIQRLCINASNQQNRHRKKRCLPAASQQGAIERPLSGIMHHLACPSFRTLKELSKDTRVMWPFALCQKETSVIYAVTLQKYQKPFVCHTSAMHTQTSLTAPSQAASIQALNLAPLIWRPACAGPVRITGGSPRAEGTTPAPTCLFAQQSNKNSHSFLAELCWHEESMMVRLRITRWS